MMSRLGLVFIVISVISCIASRDSGNAPETGVKRRVKFVIPVLNLRRAWKQCKTNDECSKDECCVFRRKNGFKMCRNMLLSGRKCNPFLKPGLSGKCSCAPGLTCSLSSSRPQNSRVIYKCVEIPVMPWELEYEEI